MVKKALLTILMCLFYISIVTTQSIPKFVYKAKNEYKIDYKDWIGVKYKFGGNDKNGIDCSGLIQKLIGCKERYSKTI